MLAMEIKRETDPQSLLPRDERQMMSPVRDEAMRCQLQKQRSQSMLRAFHAGDAEGWPRGRHVDGQALIACIVCIMQDEELLLWVCRAASYGLRSCILLQITSHMPRQRHSFLAVTQRAQPSRSTTNQVSYFCLGKCDVICNIIILNMSCLRHTLVSGLR